MNTNDRDYPNYDAAINLAAEHLSRLAIGDTFDWRSLLGEDVWSQVTAEKRAQAVGGQLARYFTRHPHPVIEYYDTNRSPRYSVWRKIGEVVGRD